MVATRRSRPFRIRPAAAWASAFLLLVLLGALPAAGCTAERPVVRGLEAVPSGHALVIEGVYRHGDQVESRLSVVIVPDRGLFRIEETEGAPLASMLLTVRTPEGQAGYRGQALLEGGLHPLETAFLRSPLTYPLEGEELRGLREDDGLWTGTLRRSGPAGYSSEEYAAAAEIDGATGLVIFESYDSGHLSWEVRRRIVPEESVTLPSLDEVGLYARADWERAVSAALAATPPVYGLRIPGLVPHKLEVGGGTAWLSYSLETDPMRTCVDLVEEPAAAGDPDLASAAGRWTETGADGDVRTVGSGRAGERWVSLSIGEGIKSISLGPDAVAAALVPLAELPDELRLGPPRLRFEGPMPLPGASPLLGRAAR